MSHVVKRVVFSAPTTSSVTSVTFILSPDGTARLLSDALPSMPTLDSVSMENYCRHAARGYLLSTTSGNAMRQASTKTATTMSRAASVADFGAASKPSPFFLGTNTAVS